MSLMSWPIPLPRFFPWSFFPSSHRVPLAGIEPAFRFLAARRGGWSSWRLVRTCWKHERRSERRSEGIELPSERTRDERFVAKAHTFSCSFLYAILHWTHWPRYRVCYAYVFSDSLFVCGQHKWKHEKGDHSILNTPIYLIWPLRIPE